VSGSHVDGDRVESGGICDSQPPGYFQAVLLATMATAGWVRMIDIQMQEIASRQCCGAEQSASVRQIVWQVCTFPTDAQTPRKAWPSDPHPHEVVIVQLAPTGAGSTRDRPTHVPPTDDPKLALQKRPAGQPGAAAQKSHSCAHATVSQKDPAGQVDVMSQRTPQALLRLHRPRQALPSLPQVVPGTLFSAHEVSTGAGSPVVFVQTLGPHSSPTGQPGSAALKSQTL
jgi:hypothetical protein